MDEALFTPNGRRPGFLAFARRFRRDRRGISAVEFALILPMMLLLYFGAYEIGEAVTINRKVTHIASTLGDLVAQSKTITGTDMENILDAAASIISPYPIGPLTITVEQVNVDNDRLARVMWGAARNDTAPQANDPVTLSDAVRQANTVLVRVEVHYQHAPRVGYVLTGNFDFSDEFILRPRLVRAITYTP